MTLCSVYNYNKYGNKQSSNGVNFCAVQNLLLDLKFRLTIVNEKISILVMALEFVQSILNLKTIISQIYSDKNYCLIQISLLKLNPNANLYLRFLKTIS